MSLTWSKALRLGLTVGFATSPAMISGDGIGEQQVNVMVQIGTGVQHAIVKRGLEEAARIYRRGGVVIEWRDLTVVRDPSCLLLTVLLRDAVRVEAAKPALGTAPRGQRGSGRMSYVFLEPIVTLASLHGVDASLVLGAAIAHELGHLLLPGRDHTDEGLMRASWGGAEAKAANRGALRFLPSDFTAMRGRLAPPVVVAAGGRQAQH